MTAPTPEVLPVEGCLDLLYTPPIALHWQNTNTGTSKTGPRDEGSRLTHLTVGSGRIDISQPEGVSRTVFVSATLAATGMDNAAIGRTLYVTEATIKTHLKTAYETLDLGKRAKIAPRLFELGIFTVARLCQVAHVNDGEKPVLELLGLGLTNREIEARLHIKAGTVKRHITSILAKHSSSSREQVGLMSILSGHTKIESRLF